MDALGVARKAVVRIRLDDFWCEASRAAGFAWTDKRLCAELEGSEVGWVTSPFGSELKSDPPIERYRRLARAVCAGST